MKLKLLSKLMDTMLGGVFVAEDSTSGQQFAIKISDLRSNKKTSEDAVEEAYLCTSIAPHANLIRVFGAFQTERCVFLKKERSMYQVLVMEYLAERDLCDYLSAHGRLAERQARLYISQLIGALRCLHSQGVCHMDISLENILLDRQASVVKLCDYGQARKMCVETKQVTIDSRYRPGKAVYMAPEIAQRDNVVNGEAVDLYSLGIVMFCLLLGFHPYESPDDSSCAFDWIVSNQLDKLLLHYNVTTDLKEAEADGFLYISKHAHDLLSKLLCSRETRIGMSELESHSWFEIN